jgi:DNA-binding transcriptional MocR family regulator
MACMAPPARITGAALARLLPDLAMLPGPAYAALSRAVTGLVQDGRVAVETRLPSERELAAELRLSRATVTAAYDEMRADGYLASRTGAGSFVTVPAGTAPRAALTRWVPRGDGPAVIDLSRATLPAAPQVAAALAAATTRIGPHLLGDGYDPHGLPELREALAARFTGRGVPTRPDQIFVTNGALSGLDLLLRLLIGPGDRVVTELPTYPGALDAIRANGGRVLPVPMAPGGGWQVAQLATTLRQVGARLAFLVPDFQNPTGALMTEADRREVLRAARRSGTTVVVDESFVDLGFPAGGDATGARAGERPSAALDPAVITLGSLSKPVWGGLRIGWLRAPAELVHRLAALRASVDLGGPAIDQLVAADLVGHLDEIAAARATELLAHRDALLAALAGALPQWRPGRPAGGMSLWVELDAPISTAMTVVAAQAGLIIVPGSRFGVDGTLERFLRLPFTLPAEQLVEAVRRLAAVRPQLGDDRPAPRQLVVA